MGEEGENCLANWQVVELVSRFLSSLHSSCASDLLCDIRQVTLHLGVSICKMEMLMPCHQNVLRTT